MAMNQSEQKEWDKLKREKEKWKHGAEKWAAEVTLLRHLAMLALRVENSDYWRKISRPFWRRRIVTLTPDQITQIEIFLSRVEDLGNQARQLRDNLTNSQRAPATAKDAQAAYVIARGYQTIDGQTCRTSDCHNLAVHIEPDGQMCCADCYRDQVLAAGAGAGEVAECHQR